MGRSPEQTYYERIRLGEMIASMMDRQRDTDSEIILEHLRPFVHKTVLNKTLTDRMILNAALLWSIRLRSPGWIMPSRRWTCRWASA